MYFTTVVAVAVVVVVHDSWDGLRQTGKEYLFEGWSSLFVMFLSAIYLPLFVLCDVWLLLICCLQYMGVCVKTCCYLSS